MIIWESKFEELAKYNADKDKTKYTQEYRRKMLRMQDEYNNESIEFIRRRWRQP